MLLARNDREKVLLLSALSQQAPKGYHRVGKFPDWVSRAGTPHKRSPTLMSVAMSSVFPNLA